MKVPVYELNAKQHSRKGELCIDISHLFVKGDGSNYLKYVKFEDSTIIVFPSCNLTLTGEMVEVDENGNIVLEGGEEMKNENKASNVQVGGSHYKDLEIQPATFAAVNNIPFLEGNVIKYVVRHKNKNGAEDIKKAIHYCNLILEHYYGDEK